MLTGGINSSRMLCAARKPKQLLPYRIYLCLFTICTALLTNFLAPILNQWDKVQLFRPLVYTICVSPLCFGGSGDESLFMRSLLEIQNHTAHDLYYCRRGALSCDRTAVGLRVYRRALSGAGVDFALAAWLTAEGIHRIDNAGMARAFLGFPALFLYLGILSPVFFGVFRDLTLCGANAGIYFPAG